MTGAAQRSGAGPLHCACFLLVAPGPAIWRPPGPRRAAAVAAMLRHLAIEAATADGRDPLWIERYVAGHGESDAEKSDRFSYLVLPSVLPGSEGDAGGSDEEGQGAAGDGRIERVLISEPAGGSGEAAHWAAQRLAGRALVPDGGLPPAAVLVPAVAEDALFERVLRPARRWASVTPVLLPGHDDRKQSKAEHLLRRALEQAGIPPERAAGIELRPEPFWSAAREARDYTAPEHLRRLPRHHVRIDFRDPSAGPIALGAGRHSGLGLFLGFPAPGRP